MLKPEPNSKSPLTLSLLIACLVIGTFVMISNYFFRPGLELDLRKKIISQLYSHVLFNPVIKVEGRDVILKGIVRNERDAAKIVAVVQNVSGVHQVETEFFIQNQID